jgi:hypothetical protein
LVIDADDLKNMKKKGEACMEVSEKNSEAKVLSSRTSSEIVEELRSEKQRGLRDRLSKILVLIVALVAGGSSVVFLGNWFLGATVFLATAFRDEAKIGGRFVFVVILVVICPGWSWEEKRQRIKQHTQILLQVLERDLVKKFLKREVV